jgi:hypothetical protein
MNQPELLSEIWDDVAEDIKEFFRQQGSHRYVACLQGLTEDVAKGILRETGDTGRGSDWVRHGSSWVRYQRP